MYGLIFLLLDQNMDKKFPSLIHLFICKLLWICHLSPIWKFSSI